MNRLTHKSCLSFTLGFTLIEILLVVIILGVIAGLAAPNFSSSFSRLELSEAAKDIAYLMRYAQGRAALKGKDHEMAFDAQSRSYVIKEDIRNDESILSQKNFQEIKGRFSGIRRIPAGLEIETTIPQFRFYPDGTIDKGRVYLKNSKGQFATVSTQEQLGYVQIFDYKMDLEDATLAPQQY